MLYSIISKIKTMRKIIFIALSLLSVVGYGQGIKISALPQAGSLTGSELTPVVQNGITKKTTVQSIANLGGGGSSIDTSNFWNINGNTGTNSTNFLGTTDAKDFVTKTNGIERFRVDTNGYILLGDRILSIRDSVNPKNILNINDADLAFQVGSLSDSLTTTFSVFNTTIEEVISSSSTGISIEHYMDTMQSMEKLSYNGLDFQQGVYDNGGTKTNITTEMNIFSPALDRDIEFAGLHYGHWQYFISDTLSGLSELPQGHGVFALDSFAISTHVTEKPTSEYASKFATKFLADTAFKFMIDSNETPVVSIHRNGIKIVDGTQGAGKVLTSDATGLASWQYDTVGSGLYLPLAGGTMDSGSHIYFGTGLQNISQGTFDNSTGGNRGISLNCAVGYELNWQGGHLSSSYNNGTTFYPVIVDTALLINGTIQITDGTQGSGKVLTSNAYGLASWQTLALTDTATLNFGSISPNGHETLTITVTGAALSDVVSLGIPNASIDAHASFVAWVSSANTVSVKCFNFDGSSFNPAAGLFTVKVFK